MFQARRTKLHLSSPELQIKVARSPPENELLGGGGLLGPPDHGFQDFLGIPKKHTPQKPFRAIEVQNL